jgi:hypothetical protein
VLLLLWLLLLLLWLLLLLQCTCGAQERLQVKAHGELNGLVDLLACAVKTTFKEQPTHISRATPCGCVKHMQQRSVHSWMSSVQEVVRGYLSILTRHESVAMHQQHVKTMARHITDRGPHMDGR